LHPAEQEGGGGGAEVSAEGGGRMDLVKGTAEVSFDTIRSLLTQEDGPLEIFPYGYIYFCLYQSARLKRKIIISTAKLVMRMIERLRNRDLNDS
jgi:hypothetical protein